MEWEIQKRSKSCHICEREFKEGNTYHCTLKFEKGVPVRRDICHHCWSDSISAEPEKEDYISYWQGRIKPKLIQKKEDPIQRSVAENLLRKYLHSSDPSYRNLCFILALMLERKKEFVQREQTDDMQSTKKLIVYEHTKTGETFIIEDPQLNFSEIAIVQKQVSSILEMEQVAINQE